MDNDTDPGPGSGARGPPCTASTWSPEGVHGPAGAVRLRQDQEVTTLEQTARVANLSFMSGGPPRKESL